MWFGTKDMTQFWLEKNTKSEHQHQFLHTKDHHGLRSMMSLLADQMVWRVCFMVIIFLNYGVITFIAGFDGRGVLQYGGEPECFMFSS
jgi:hypothetical protein